MTMMVGRLSVLQGRIFVSSNRSSSIYYQILCSTGQRNPHIQNTTQFNEAYHRPMDTIFSHGRHIFAIWHFYFSWNIFGRVERLWERTTGSRGWSTSSMSTWTRWSTSSSWRSTVNFLKLSLHIWILFVCFTSTTSTLNVRQKIIPMMLRLNYPSTWR